MQRINIIRKGSETDVQPTRRVPGFQPTDVRSLNHARISIEVFAWE